MHKHKTHQLWQNRFKVFNINSVTVLTVGLFYSSACRLCSIQLFIIIILHWTMTKYAVPIEVRFDLPSTNTFSSSATSMTASLLTVEENLHNWMPYSGLISQNIYFWIIRFLYLSFPSHICTGWYCKGGIIEHFK